MENVKCTICSGQTSEVMSYEVTGGYLARLVRCDRCTMTFIANPEWLEASFSNELNSHDVGSADRSILVAGFVRSLLRSRSLGRACLLDFGGGDGLAVRYLRDHGVDCRWEDPFCSPRFFVGPDANDVPRFSLIFLSEVALHFTDPLAVVTELLERSEKVLMTAVVPPDPIPQDWWYLMPSTGQHVAFFSQRALEEMAKKMSAELITDGRFFHMFCRTRPTVLERLCFRSPSFALLRWKAIEVSDLARRSFGKRRSLTEFDQSLVMTGGGL